MNCEFVRRYMDAYLDGELEPGTQLDFDQHLGACAPCQSTRALEQAFKTRVHDGLGHVAAPEHLRARILDAIRVDDVSRQEAADVIAAPRAVGVRRLGWKGSAAVLAVAAALVVAYLRGGSVGNPVEQASMMPMLEDVVRMHANALPADVTSDAPDNVRAYFRDKVEFPVRPAVFVSQPAKLVGARLGQVRDRRAAALYYDVGGRRVTVVVFNGDMTDPSEHTRLSGRDIQYRRIGGYTVPVIHDDGISYALTGDMDGPSLLHLAATARVAR